jgi:ribosomal protein S4
VYVKKKRYNFKKEFTDVRLARHFYVTHTYKLLHKIIKKAKKKDGLFETNLISFMECRLPSFIYRTSFLPNMFESINFIKNNNIAVNKIFKPMIYFVIKVMDIITFRV